ncbi:MAG: hypothetical protein IJ521_10510 [Schwartzia sp.]|nr:hypothetical protein [Schwartzia sp. (in: firmicutes)]
MNLLLDDRPLVILPTLAKELGNLNEAVFLQQLHYWLDIKKQTGKNFVDGRYWVYNSLDEWLEQFSWMTKATLRRTIDSLVSKGFVIKGNFNQRKMDHTVWYSINYEKVMEIEEKSKKEKDEQAKAALDKAENDDNNEIPESLVSQGTCRCAQNEHIDMLKSTHRCAQNEHIDMLKLDTSMCSK